MENFEEFITPDHTGERRRIRNSVNALRHGLTTIRRSNPIYAPDILAIAKTMCPSTDEALFEKALLVAECDVAIAHIRQYKLYLIARMADPDCLPTNKNKAEFISRRAKLRRLHGVTDKMLPFPRDRSDPAFGDFALRMAEYWGSPGGIELPVIRALPDLVKVTNYEIKIWRMRRRRFLQFLSVKAGR